MMRVIVLVVLLAGASAVEVPDKGDGANGTDDQRQWGAEGFVVCDTAGANTGANAGAEAEPTPNAVGDTVADGVADGVAYDCTDGVADEIADHLADGVADQVPNGLADRRSDCQPHGCVCARLLRDRRRGLRGLPAWSVQ